MRVFFDVNWDQTWFEMDLCQNIILRVHRHEDWNLGALLSGLNHVFIVVACKGNEGENFTVWTPSPALQSVLERSNALPAPFGGLTARSQFVDGAN